MRALWQIVASWLLCFAVGTVVSGLTLVTLGWFARAWGPQSLRLWAKGMLWIAGVTISVEGEEHLTADSMKVATFNHGSMLDAFLIPAIFPRGGTAAIKQQVMYYPIVGITLWLVGFVIIDRGNTARARRTMDRAAARMARHRLTVFIAPEGTRAKTPELLPFKKGALHLALATKAPVVPVVIDGAFDLHPPGRWTTRPGHVRIRVLPPRPSTALTAETVGAETDALREVYERELAAMRAEKVAPKLAAA